MGSSDLEIVKQLNIDLVQQLEVKNKQIEELRSHLDELLNDEHDGLKDRKIAELLRKNKTITVRLNKERGVNAQLQEQLDNAKRQLEEVQQQSPSRARQQQSTASEDGSSTDTEAALQEFRSKYERSLGRISALREELQKGQKENTRMRQLLVKEIGDDEDIEKYINNPDGYRGRAQQIHILKSRLRKQRQQTNEQARIETNDGSPATKLNESSSHCIDEKARATVSKIEQGRRNDATELQKRLEDEEYQSKKIKREMASVQARNRILEDSVSDLKVKMSRLLDKVSVDAKLINALREELNNVQKKKRENARLFETARNSRSKNKPSSANSSTSSTISSYIRPLASKSETSENENVSMFQMQQMRQMEERIKTLEKMNDKQAREIIVKHDLVRDLRNEIQRLCHTGIERLRTNTNEASENELQLRLTVSRIEIEKLQELCDLLEKKVKEYEENNRNISDKYMQERHRVLELTQKLDSLDMGSSQRRSNLTRHLREGDEQTLKVLKDQLDLAHDEVHALREALHSTTKSKSDEARIYHDMIEQQKQRFTMHIAELKHKLENAGISVVSPTVPEETEPTRKNDEEKDLLISQLRSDLQEMKSRYNALAMQQQISSMRAHGADSRASSGRVRKKENEDNTDIIPSTAASTSSWPADHQLNLEQEQSQKQRSTIRSHVEDFDISEYEDDDNDDHAIEDSRIPDDDDDSDNESNGI